VGRRACARQRHPGNPAISANDRQHDIASTNLLLEHADEVPTRVNILNINEELLRRKGPFETAVERLYNAPVLATSIIDEYLDGHVRLSLQSSRSVIQLGIGWKEQGLRACSQTGAFARRSSEIIRFSIAALQESAIGSC
jgi:hypothetical protein